ncbi:MAG: prohibitin family protein, partial [Ignavibacteriales bacterium]
MLFVIALVAAVVAAFVYFNAKKRYNKPESNFALAGFLVAVVIALLQCWTVI